MTMTAGVLQPFEPSAVLAGRIPDPPYTGIRPFEEHEWPIFFGRGAIVEELLERLSQDRFVAVMGASGGGKSSLVKAGLFATLKHKHARLGVQWVTVTMRPAGAPMWSLAEALYEVATQGRSASRLSAPVEAIEPFRVALARGRDAIAATLAEHQLPGNRNLLLLVDQFEELFRYDLLGGEAEIEAFLDQLMDVVDRPPEGFYLALTMRSDFLGDCARFPRLADALNRSSYLLRRMTDDELTNAIVTPAELLGGRVEPDLIQRLLREAKGEQDHLVLLQHAMAWLWTRERRQNLESGTPDAAVVLDTADYLAASGMTGALSQHLNLIYDGLGGAEAALARREMLQLAAKRMFQALVDIGDQGRATRRPLRFDQLAEEIDTAPELLAEVIEAFRAPGRSFLVPSPPRPIEKATVIDISHEALIRQWDKLGSARGWLSEEQADAETWARLRARTRAFAENRDRLLDIYETREFEEFRERRQPTKAWLRRYDPVGSPASDKIDPQATALLEASRRNERRRKLKDRMFRVFVPATILALCVLVVMGWLAYEAITGQKEAVAERNVADQKRKQAEYERQRAEYERQRAEGEAKRVMLLLEQLQQSSRNISNTAAALETAKSATPVGGDVYRQIVQAQRSLETQAANLDVSARVYIHIANESQRVPAEDLRRRLGQLRVSGIPVSAPGVERVSSDSGNSTLRCFRREECGVIARKLLDDINDLLEAPRVVLSDLSGRYQQSATIRPWHFELWFGPGPIVLRESSQNSPSSAPGSGTVTIPPSSPPSSKGR